MPVITSAAPWRKVLTAKCHQRQHDICTKMSTKPVVKVPFDARERSSCTSNYWNPAFPHLKFNKKRSGAKSTCLEAQSWRTVPSLLIFHFKHCTKQFTNIIHTYCKKIRWQNRSLPNGRGDSECQRPTSMLLLTHAKQSDSQFSSSPSNSTGIFRFISIIEHYDLLCQKLVFVLPSCLHVTAFFIDQLLC